MEQRLPSSDGKSNTGAHFRYRIEDRSYFSIIKKDIAREAEALGFTAEKIGKLQIIVAELASNLVKFGVKGREFLWKPVENQGVPGIEMLAIDKGPGIANVNRALEDGYSTSGTAGEGLGAIRRQSSFFDIYSRPAEGTIVLSRLFAHEEVPHTREAFTVAALSVPKPGEKLCGDGYAIDYKPNDSILNLLVLDGLGHGPEAHKAAEAAIQEYTMLPKDSPAGVMKSLHESIKKTRGAVGLSVFFNYKAEVLTYCGIGNISSRLISYDNVRTFSSFNGIVGHVMSTRIHDQELPWERGKLLIVHSDGITSRWDTTKYFQMQKHDPAILAASLYRDNNRQTDDVTIVVSRFPKQ